MPATDQQVQQFVNERIRPHCELIRNLKILLDDDIASIDDVYANLTAQNPTWTDTRSDAPPNLLTPNDVLAINSLINAVRDEIRDNANYGICVQACVRSPGV